MQTTTGGDSPNNQGTGRPQMRLVSTLVTRGQGMNHAAVLSIQTGYSLDFTDQFDPATLTDQDVVLVRSGDSPAYPRRYDAAEFKDRSLQVVGLLTGFHWKRPTTHTEGAAA